MARTQAKTPVETIYVGGASGTHNVTPGCTRLEVELIASGGGGGGSGTSGGNGGNGNSTSFGTLSATGGGLGGGSANGSTAPGVPTVGSGWTQLDARSGVWGVAGGSGNFTGTNLRIAGGMGGGSPFGPGGTPGGGGASVAGTASTAYGAGGGAGSPQDSANPLWGAGGSSGGYLKARASTILTSYAYSVGLGGTAGAAGTGGGAGSVGTQGVLIVREYFD